MTKGKRKPSKHARKPASTDHTMAAPSADWLIVGLAGFGMLITAYLTASSWMDQGPALCAAGSGCDLIRQSRWSTVLGLPVALWGFGLYALIALIAWRSPARLKRWRRLWTLALIGFAISAYLTIVGLVELGALCPWCMTSFASISAIVVALHLRRPESAPGMPWLNWLSQTAGTALIAVAILHIWYSDWLEHPDTPRLAELAAHLESIDARFYGAWWCPACQEQKDLFHGAGEQLPFVECSLGGQGSGMRSLCRERGVENYPTWIIKGRRYEGALPPEQLARYAGFDWEAAAD